MTIHNHKPTMKTLKQIKDSVAKRLTNSPWNYCLELMGDIAVDEVVRDYSEELLSEERRIRLNALADSIDRGADGD